MERLNDQVNLVNGFYFNLGFGRDLKPFYRSLMNSPLKELAGLNGNLDQNLDTLERLKIDGVLKIVFEDFAEKNSYVEKAVSNEKSLVDSYKGLLGEGGWNDFCGLKRGLPRIVDNDYNNSVDEFDKIVNVSHLKRNGVTFLPNFRDYINRVVGFCFGKVSMSLKSLDDSIIDVFKLERDHSFYGAQTIVGS